MSSLDIRRVNAPAQEDEEVIDITGDLVRRNAMEGLVSLAHERASGESQYKNFIFTWNNPDVSEDNQFKGANLWLYFRSKQHLDIKYMAWSYEVGQSGTPHYQGFIQIKNKMRLKTMRAKFNNASIWVAAAMSPSQARKYCLHLGEFSEKELVHDDAIWEHGKWDEPAQGKRTDLASVTDMIVKGSTIREVALADPSTFVKFHSGLAKLEAIMKLKTRTTMTQLYIYWGKAGTGKSHRAREEALEYLSLNGIDEEPYYMVAPAKKTEKTWFHGYEGEACVIIDDFYGTIGIDQMKNLIDKYPCKVEVKNGHKQWLAQRVWITSNQPWESWWGVELMRGDNKAAIQRRITAVEEMNERYQEPEYHIPSGILGEGVSDDSVIEGRINLDDGSIELPLIASALTVPDNANPWGWE